MKITIKNNSYSPRNTVQYVICSVLEDVNKNFDKYAPVLIEDFNEMDSESKACLDKWKSKVFDKLDKFLEKDLFNNGAN